METGDSEQEIFASKLRYHLPERKSSTTRAFLGSACVRPLMLRQPLVGFRRVPCVVNFYSLAARLPLFRRSLRAARTFAHFRQHGTSFTSRTFGERLLIGVLQAPDRVRHAAVRYTYRNEVAIRDESHRWVQQSTNRRQVAVSLFRLSQARNGYAALRAFKRS